MSRLVSFWLLVVIAIAIAIVSFRVLSGFLLPIFVAVLLVVMFRPLHEWINARLGGRARVSAALTTLAILLIVLLPALGIFAKAAAETVSFVRGFDVEEARMRLGQLRTSLGFNIPPEADDAMKSLETLLQDGDDPLDSLATDQAKLQAMRVLVEEADALSLRIEEVLNLAKRIDAADLGAATPAPTDDAPIMAPTVAAPSFLPKRDHTEDWARFRQSLFEVSSFVDAHKTIEGRDREHFSTLVDTANVDLNEFRRGLFGNPVLAWVGRQANPDPRQLEAARAAIEGTVGPWAWNTTQFLGSFVIEFLFGMAILILSVYYFFADGPAIIDGLVRLIPLDEKYQRQLLREFDNLSRAVVLSVLLAALVQGLLAGVGYFFAGMHSVFLLTVLSIVFALVPFVGATIIWGSCCVWLGLIEGRTGAAIGLALWGLLVVSMVDNVVRPLVLHGKSNIHPLLALLSVLGGVRALGPIGLFVGPMVVALLQTVLVMLRSELRAINDEKLTAPRPHETTPAQVT